MALFLLIILTLYFAHAASFNLSDGNIIPEGRITKGNYAEEGQFPYQVYLSVKEDLNSSVYYTCGASIIDNEWILTAAHCTKTVVQATVYLGATNIFKSEKKHIVSADKFIVHSGYHNLSLKNDIALIRIPYTNYTNKIQPIQLPSSSDTNSTFEGQEVVMSGWGRTSQYNTSSADYLQWANFHIIPNSLCAETYPGQVFASTICIGTGNGISTCKGDSGGPLVLNSSKIQIGIDSFGYIPGCQMDKPGGFTRITSYLEWIKNHTKIF